MCEQEKPITINKARIMAGFKPLKGYPMYSHPDSFLQPIIMRPELPFNGEVAFTKDATHGWRVISVLPCPNVAVRFPKQIILYTKQLKNKPATLADKTLVIKGDFKRIPRPGFCVHPHKLVAWKEVPHEQ